MSSLQSRIARRAKISQSTVSRALNNHPALPQATCKRVQQIARQLGYEANPLVSSVFSAMRRRQNKESLGTLAFLSAHATREGWRKVATYRDFFLGAQARATRQGFGLETHWATEPGITGPRLGDILQARGIAGLIVSSRASTEDFPELPWDKFALVRLGVSQKKLPFHCVVNHQFNTARLVAGKLASRGYARIGLAVTAWQNEVVDQCWLGGFLAWQQGQPTARRVPVKIFPEVFAEPFMAWFRRHRPDAIVAVNPDVIDLLRAENYKVPQDMGVALLDWHDNYGDVAGADQNNRLVGSKAVDILLSQLHRNELGIPDHPFRMMIESSWREGSTVRPSRKS